MDIIEAHFIPTESINQVKQPCANNLLFLPTKNNCNLLPSSITVDNNRVKKVKSENRGIVLAPSDYRFLMELHMITYTMPELLYIIITSTFLLGVVTFVTGVIILITRTMGKDLSSITRQTSELAQKGLIDDLSGLVGNASALLTATSQMIRTTAGIGILLIILGIVQIGTAIGLILYLN
jgi:hypothetical protein